MVKSQNIIPESGIRTSFDKEGIDLYTEVTKTDLYKVVLSLESKIVRVSPELLRDLIDFNQRKHSKENPWRHYSPDLASFKKAKKYNGRDNKYVLELDRLKYLTELGHFANKNELVQDMMLVISQKTGKVLGIWYKILKWDMQKVRCYIRYSTLSEKRQKAETVIELMSQRYEKIFELKN